MNSQSAIKKTERINMVLARIQELYKSTDGTEPLSWGKFTESKMMNPWKYPEKGAFEVWMDGKQNKSL